MVVGSIGNCLGKLFSEGDCEDYSFLLVSLYRAVEYSARVFVVVGKNENTPLAPYGVGHGWVRVQIDVIGWQNIEPQAPALATIVGDYLSFRIYCVCLLQ